MKSRRTSIQIMADVLFALLLREFQTRFGSRRMGAFWMIFEPAIHVLVMLFIFSMLRANSIQGMDYPIFLLTGMIPFFMMRNIAQKLMDSVGANQALFAYPNIKILDTYIARTLVEIIIYSLIYIIFIFILGYWFALDVNIAHPIGFLGALLVGILFSFGLGILLSILVQAAPSLKSFISIMFMAFYFLSGVIFPLWIIPEKYLNWLLLNPYAHIISNIRDSVFAYYPDISGVNMTYPTIATIVILFCALGLYKVRKERLLMK